MTGPYAAAALRYRAAGWVGVLPLPARAKARPPEGFTGVDGIDPSGADVHAWTESHGVGNVALRLPGGVVGLDVDAYDDRGGDATLARAEARWGALPATWRVTARADGVSGIRLFRVPAGRRFLGTFGMGTEVVQRAHRYVVAAPSVHPTGAVYAWHGPAGEARIPRSDEVPELPPRWVEALTVADRRARTRKGRRPAARPAAPSEPPVERLMRRAGVHDPVWIVAQLDDHLRQLRKAATPTEARDLAEACGFLTAQASALGLVDDARERLDAAVSPALFAACTAGVRRAAAAPWQLASA